MTKDSKEAIVDLINNMAIELLGQAHEQSKLEGSNIVSVDHVEKILPRVLMDFS